jgi:hypothetical protein
MLKRLRLYVDSPAVTIKKKSLQVKLQLKLQNEIKARKQEVDKEFLK